MLPFCVTEIPYLKLVCSTFSGVSLAHFTNAHNVSIELVHLFDAIVHFACLVHGLDVAGADLNCIFRF